MNRIVLRENHQRGVALLTAVALLLVFSILGSAYLRYMTLEAEKASLEKGRVLAYHAAEGGVYAALDEVKKAIAEKRTAALLKQPATTIAFPSYQLSGDEQHSLVTREDEQIQVTWAVRDESGKLNLNHAPASALRVILGVDGAKAREIRASLPRSEEGAATQGTERWWFSSLDDLVLRGLISSDSLKSIDRSSVTVYTVPDPDQPFAYINLNTASPKVLEAVLDVSPEVARNVAAARPFYSLADVCQAAGKPATMFNFKPESDAPDAMPKALAFESNAFRVFARAQVKQSSGKTIGTASVETVVVIMPDGRSKFTLWRTFMGDRAGAVAESSTSETAVLVYEKDNVHS